MTSPSLNKAREPIGKLLSLLSPFFFQEKTPTVYLWQPRISIMLYITARETRNGNLVCTRDNKGLPGKRELQWFVTILSFGHTDPQLLPCRAELGNMHWDCTGFSALMQSTDFWFTTRTRHLIAKASVLQREREVLTLLYPLNGNLQRNKS